MAGISAAAEMLNVTYTLPTETCFGRAVSQAGSRAGMQACGSGVEHDRVDGLQGSRAAGRVACLPARLVPWLGHCESWAGLGLGH